MLHAMHACFVLLLSLLPATAIGFAGAHAPAHGDGDFTVGPTYSVDPALTFQGNRRGLRFNVTMQLSESKIFNGTDPTFDGMHCGGPRPAECCDAAHGSPSSCTINHERHIQVYVPWQLVSASTVAPILVMQDGPGWLNEVAYALDNLVGASHSDRSLPAFVAISVENGGSDAIKSERGLEYDTMSDRYARLIDTEVIPAVLRSPEMRASCPNLRLSKDPADRATFGCSSGGAAALTMAWFRPDLFRRVVAYSATLVDQQDHAAPSAKAFPFGAWEYHSSMQLLRRTPKKPLRVFTHCSEMDIGFNLSASPTDATGNTSVDNTAGDPTHNWTDKHHNWRVAGNRTAVALQKQGYSYRHVFGLGAHHCDARVLNQTLADTLVWLWQSDLSIVDAASVYV